MGTTADKLSALMASKEAIQQTMLSCHDLMLNLGNKVSEWSDRLANGPYIRKYGTDVTPYEDANRWGYGYSQTDAILVSKKNMIPVVSVDMSDVSVIGNMGLYNAYYYQPYVRHVDMPRNLLSVTNNTNIMNYAFCGCSALTGHIDFNCGQLAGYASNSQAFTGMFAYTDVSSVRFTLPPEVSSTVVTGTAQLFNMCFYKCDNLRQVDVYGLSVVTRTTRNTNNIFGNTAANNAFAGCSALTSITFHDLVDVGTYNNGTPNNYCNLQAFSSSNTALIEVNFPELTCLNGPNSLANPSIKTDTTVNTQLIDVYVPKLQYLSPCAFANIYGRFHFRDSMGPIVSELGGYDTMFGAATGSQVLFDL